MPPDNGIQNGIPLVVGAIAGIALTPVLAPVALGIFGFSALGPVAGTFAAVIQSGIGNVAAGSLFATAQSVAMGGAIPAVVTAVGAGVGAVVGAMASSGDSGDGGDGDVTAGDRSDSDGSDGSPPSAVNSRFLVVVQPYPLGANLERRADRRALALWLASCVGKDALLAVFYRPSSLEKVVIEVNRECDSFNELLGKHLWSEFLVEPTKEEMGKSSMIFFSTFNPRSHAEDGWKRVKIEEHWFKGFDNNSIFKHPYPLSQQSFPMPRPPPAPPVGSEAPAASVRRPNAGSTSSFTEKSTAEPSDSISVTSSGSKTTEPYPPTYVHSSNPSSVEANDGPKNNARKRGPPSVFSKAPAGTLRASSTVDSFNALSSRRASSPPSPPDLGPGLTSPTRKILDWNEKVEKFKSERINSPPTSPPPPGPAPRQLHDPNSPIEPPQYNEKDQLSYPTVAAAMTNLFDDDYLIENSSIMSVSTSQRNKGPTSSDPPSGNAPAYVSPTSPGHSTRQPAWASRRAASQSAGSYLTWSSISRPTSASAASSNTDQRSSASEARSSVSSTSTGTYDPVTSWVADVAGQQRNHQKGAEGGQKISKNARKRRNRATRKARAQAAQASVFEGALDESSWGDPDAMSESWVEG